MRLLHTTLAAAFMAISTMPAQAVTNEDVDNSFFPYRDGVPAHADLKAGAVIDQSNVEQFKEAL
ncbi:MAG: DUF1329 domain-containing protein, partial [Candidatus Thiodiazotropha sp.]|nr:DUF1329 domain-containing protein [Candidatus Thiodiazotropha sp.]